MRAATRPGIVAPPVRNTRAAWIGLGAVALLVAVTAVWGAVLDGQGRGIGLHAAPLFAAASARFGVRVLLPVAVAVLVVWSAPVVVERVTWRQLVGITVLATAAWGVALALVDFGGEGLVRGVSSPVDLLAAVERISAPGPFLDTFTERIGAQVVHVRGHPPGLVVALWWMARAGLGGAVPMAGLAVVGSACAVAAALVVVREVAGEQMARRAAPFLVLSPAAIWLVSSADAIYAGLGAVGVAATIVATGREKRASDVLAALGGVLLGLAFFTSYGLVLIGVVPFVVAIARRRMRPLVVAGFAMLAVGAGFAAFGFSWIEGFTATRAQYAASIAAARPYGYFVFANLAAFAIVLGPAAIAGAPVLRDRRLWLLVGAGLFAVLLADLSGLSKGEVERIWLPFWPWVAVAAAAVASRVRWWLAAQATLAIGIQTFLGTPW